MVNGVNVDTCSNKGCNGCCGSSCSWMSTYCIDRIVAECPSGYIQSGTLSENNNVEGSGLSQTQEDSIEDCQALCESTEGCVAFMYGGRSTVHDSKRCQLSSNASPNNSFGSNFRFCKKLSFSDNVVEENAVGVGGWGGSCTCPDGSVYQVGDNKDRCGSLACFGGVSGTCNRFRGEWSSRKVTCGQIDNGCDGTCRVRRNWNDMSPDDRRTYIETVNIARRDEPYKAQYDALVSLHGIDGTFSSTRIYYAKSHHVLRFHIGLGR